MGLDFTKAPTISTLANIDRQAGPLRSTSEIGCTSGPPP
jgi:hypothetical protein